MKTRREQLEQKEKQALIEGYLLLEDRVRTLEKQVNDLRQLLKERLPKTPENSSVPSSQSRKAVVKESVPAKRGGKAGHVGKSRARGVADEVVEYRVSQCAACGEDLSGLAQHEVGRHQIIDVPPMRAVVREVVRYGRYCPRCGRYHRAAAPVGMEPGRVIGRQLEQWVLYLHYAHPLSYQRVQQILAEMWGITLSEGALVNCVKRAEGALKQAAAAIHSQVTQAAVIGSDETGVRVGGRNHWQWVFQTPQWVYHVIRPSRSARVVAEVMGAARPEVWVSDVLSSQLCHPAAQSQICLAHQVRDLQYVMDSQACVWASDLQTLFYQAIALGQQADRQSAAYPEAVAGFEQRLDALLAQYPPSPDSQRLWRRYRKHRHRVLLFLARDDVPPTNNASEQALRNSVVYRKVTGGFRTAWGADLYANFLSLLETSRRQGADLFATLTPLFAPSLSSLTER